MPRSQNTLNTGGDRKQLLLVTMGRNQLQPDRHSIDIKAYRHGDCTKPKIVGRAGVPKCTHILRAISLNRLYIFYCGWGDRNGGARYHLTGRKLLGRTATQLAKASTAMSSPTTAAARKIAGADGSAFADARRNYWIERLAPLRCSRGKHFVNLGSDDTAYFQKFYRRSSLGKRRTHRLHASPPQYS